jgi:hypothetical protein
MPALWSRQPRGGVSLHDVPAATKPQLPASNQTPPRARTTARKRALAEEEDVGRPVPGMLEEV